MNSSEIPVRRRKYLGALRYGLSAFSNKKKNNKKKQGDEEIKTYVSPPSNSHLRLLRKK